MLYNDYCLSSFLAFRYVVESGKSWCPGVTPSFPVVGNLSRRPVTTADHVFNELKDIVTSTANLDKTGILLSGGIDSAILSSFLPPGSKAYTIKFIADGALDESIMAKEFAAVGQLKHKVVEVRWSDYLESMNTLIAHKKSPLHAIEVALYKAAVQARADGLDTLIVGNGADTTFGGMDKLLSRDWTLEEFIHRYTFVDPQKVLQSPVSMHDVFEAYDGVSCFDVPSFLKTVHGLGIVQSFDESIQAAGCRVLAPYEELYLDASLDMARIRGGESKYILNTVFNRLFPKIEAPKKIPFARPMDQWLAAWEGPKRREFRTDIDILEFTGEQKWLLYCLEHFLDYFEEQV